MPNKRIFLFFAFWVMILAAVFVFLSREIIKTTPGTDIKGGKKIIDKNKGKCDIESCHGLNITCGEKVPEVCSEQYQLGDNCRQFVRCEFQDGQCNLLGSKNFSRCKNCVERCQSDSAEDVVKMFQCEGKCHKEINETDEAVLN